MNTLQEQFHAGVLSPGDTPPVEALPEAISESAAAEPVRRLDHIDGLRGTALLMVFLYHAWLCAGQPPSGWWNAGSGYIGVNLFLTLSGFCLYWPLVKDAGRRSEPTLRQFAARRARRILPPYYVAMTLFAGIALAATVVKPLWAEQHQIDALSLGKQFVWHLLMIHNLRPEYVFTLAGPFWSLALECELYVAMPLLVFVAHRYSIGRAVLLAAAVTLAYRIFLDWWIGGAQVWNVIGNADGFTLCYFLPGRWLEFALGMWAAAILAGGGARAGRLPCGALALVFLAAGVVLSHKYGQLTALSDPLFGLGFFCLILNASLPGQGRVVAEALRWRPLVWLGTISYSVYLLHNPLLNFLASFVQNRTSSSMWIMTWCIGLFLPLIVAVSWRFYLLFEKPFIGKPKSRLNAMP